VNPRALFRVIAPTLLDETMLERDASSIDVV
jgi:hypothetical protein